MRNKKMAPRQRKIESLLQRRIKDIKPVDTEKQEPFQKFSFACFDLIEQEAYGPDMPIVAEA